MICEIPKFYLENQPEVIRFFLNKNQAGKGYLMTNVRFTPNPYAMYTEQSLMENIWGNYNLMFDLNHSDIVDEDKPLIRNGHKCGYESILEKTTFAPLGHYGKQVDNTWILQTLGRGSIQFIVGGHTMKFNLKLPDLPTDQRNFENPNGISHVELALI